MDATKAMISTILSRYQSETPKRLKIIDAYLLYVMLTGAIQFLYALMVGSFPFNSILSGFISCVGSFVLGVGLRLQVNDQNKDIFVGITNERAFAFHLCSYCFTFSCNQFHWLRKYVNKYELHGK